RNGLEQAKDAIIEFIASQWNHEHLARVPELLTQVRGGLAMIPLQRAADLLNACNRYIQEQLLARKAVPNWQSLDTLADAITSVEYYLERLAEDRGAQGDLILDVAEESLEALGYPLKEKPSILDRVETAPPTPAPLADPLQEIELLGAEEISLEQPLAAAEDVGLAGLELDEADWLVDAQPLADAEVPATDEAFSFELDAFDELSLEPATTPPSFDAEPEFELEELSLDDVAGSAQWDELELAELELPEVELPEAPVPSVVVEVIETEKPLSMADVMAAPVQAINPPAADVPPSLLPPPADEEPVDEELLEVFIEEAAEVLETIAEYLPQWQADTGNKDALIEVRRAFHTLKGSGRMVRALIIGELAWSIENLLNRVLDRSIEPSEPVQQVVLDVVALMPALVEEFAAKAQRQRDDVDLLAATAHALAKGLTPPKSDAPAAQQVAEPVGVD